MDINLVFAFPSPIHLLYQELQLLEEEESILSTTHKAYGQLSVSH